jgi:hypothetical protein
MLGYTGADREQAMGFVGTVRRIWETSTRVPRKCVCSFLMSFLFSIGAVGSAAQNADITCDRGSGEYATTFQTGITVSVNAVKAGELSTRKYEAKLSWTGGELELATSVEQVGIDVLGSDLGFRVPVVALQIRASSADARSEYRIYSLEKPPRLLRTIKGGSAYRAVDTYLHGHLEIWTDDTIAVDGFEDIPAASFDFAPTVVLRFENRRLVDVSSEFRSHYNQQIAEVRAQIDSHDLDDFRSTDGTLNLFTTHPGERLQRLLRVKTQALEIVWSYLYSNREREAWQALAAMWPVADIDRIHSLLASLHPRGILAQTEGPEHKTNLGVPKLHVEIYDIWKPDERGSNGPSYSSSLGPGGLPREVSVIEPKSILLRRSAQSRDNLALLDSNELLELTVDAAGKVHSARILNGTDTSLISATKSWQFIPAFRNGEPVACRFRLRVWDLR